VQNSVGPNDMGVASSSRAFFQQIGGSIGVSLFGVVFIRRLNEGMSSRVPGVHLASNAGAFSPTVIDSLPIHIRDAAFYAISHAEDGVFWWTIPATVLVFILAVCIKEIPLRGRSQPAGEPSPATPELVHEEA
jgi:hypothetical protein